MGSCYLGDHIAGDHIHMDITTCNIEEPLRKQKYRLETASNRLLGRLNMLTEPKHRPLLL